MLSVCNMYSGNTQLPSSLSAHKFFTNIAVPHVDLTGVVSCFRGMIRIDYDDGTQEVSEIPDSDIVIYPWRPTEQRVRPRSLAQMRAEEEKEKASKSETANKSESGTSNATGNPRKVSVKTESRLMWAAPRGKTGQGSKRNSVNSNKREPPRAPPPRAGTGRGAPKSAAAASAATGTTSPPSPPASSSSSDSGESEEEDEEGGDDSEEDDEMDSREPRKNNVLQQRNGKASLAAKGRASSQRPGPRKRPGVRNGRGGGSATKRRRGPRDGERDFNDVYYCLLFQNLTCRVSICVFVRPVDPAPEPLRSARFGIYPSSVYMLRYPVPFWCGVTF